MTILSTTLLRRSLFRTTTALTRFPHYLQSTRNLSVVVGNHHYGVLRQQAGSYGSMIHQGGWWRRTNNNGLNNNDKTSTMTGSRTTPFLTIGRSFANGLTKRKKKRLARYFRRKAMREAGIEVPKPPRYMDPHTPVKNAIPREEQERIKKERRQYESLTAPKPPEKKRTDLPALLLPYQESVQETKQSLTISPKVAKVLALTNATQRRVVQSQKVAGMKLFRLRAGDTGSSPVQIIALTARIQQMDTHLIMHPKDKAGKRRTAILRARRRKLLDYLENKDFPAYSRVSSTLGLR